jgi:hypothetical protein
LAGFSLDLAKSPAYWVSFSPKWRQTPQRDYYRIPVRSGIDRKQFPDWMNVPFVRMPIDWELLRKQSNDWLRYWDTNIRGRGK